MTDLTKTQQAILKAICRSIRDTGRQPTIREIGQRFGITSPNGVVCHLKALQRKGYVERMPQQAGLVIKEWKSFI